MSLLFSESSQKLRSATFWSLTLAVVGSVSFATYSLAALTDSSNFRQVINPGTLSVEIVDAAYVNVAAPAVNFTAVDASLSCQTSTGTFGTATEQIYVQNPDAADGGWSVTIAATNTTDLWTATVSGQTYDFNDPAGSGCTSGQMTVDASGGTIAVGQVSGNTTGISVGASAAFSSGVVDDITIFQGAAGSDDIGDWTLQGISVSQEIPGAQAAENDYNIDMVITIA